MFFLRSLAFLVACALCAEESTGTSPEEALRRLKEGNQRFVAATSTAAGHNDMARRTALARSQAPFAVILCCSDSRVPPELIFDQGLGDLFVVRVAGNIPDPVVLGSLEYAAEHLGAALILVLGHERCGAVTAAVSATGVPEGNIGAILRILRPAVKQAKAQCATAAKPELVECAIDANIRGVQTSILRRSKVLAHLSHEGKLRIEAAKYDLDEGTVAFFSAVPPSH